MQPLRRIWFVSDQLCGKRLKAVMPIWLPHYESEYGSLPESVRTDLLMVSAPTHNTII